ncbi:hypothetical protein BDN70DRAFT_886124 [Pholiota conissans]|uniref:Uncharacterized protein n=1 Tax=Pholiota conissans TaxID=109636 RepID=A0A9P5YSY0_9AGAR|nr:hypothetical protein BDN70DRAFT_886124 [Pholiota conissans]
MHGCAARHRSRSPVRHSIVSSQFLPLNQSPGSLVCGDAPQLPSPISTVIPPRPFAFTLAPPSARSSLRPLL